jgi:pilus assembly protein Flp/PilA
VPVDITKSPRLYQAGLNVPLGFWRRQQRMKIMRRFLADETAATAIEYGLIAAGIALAIIAAVNGIGAKLNTKFSSINSSLK